MATATSRQTTSATLDRNKALIRQAFEALNARDREAFADVHADDVVLYDVDDPLDGIDTVIEQEWAMFDAFPDMRYSLDEMVAEDDMVACRWTAAGTHRGRFQGIDPTDRTIEISVGGMFRIEDGKVTEGWLNADRLGLLQQLGVAEGPESAR